MELGSVSAGRLPAGSVRGRLHSARVRSLGGAEPGCCHSPKSGRPPTTRTARPRIDGPHL